MRVMVIVRATKDSEIRQVFEAEDFAARDPSGKIRQNEANLRTRIESRYR